MNLGGNLAPTRNIESSSRSFHGNKTPRRSSKVANSERSLTLTLTGLKRSVSTDVYRR